MSGQLQSFVHTVLWAIGWLFSDWDFSVQHLSSNTVSLSILTWYEGLCLGGLWTFWWGEWGGAQRERYVRLTSGHNKVCLLWDKNAAWDARNASLYINTHFIYCLFILFINLLPKCLWGEGGLTAFFLLLILITAACINLLQGYHNWLALAPFWWTFFLCTPPLLGMDKIFCF